MSSTPLPGSVRYKFDDRYWQVVEPHSPSYSSALMLAEEVWTEQGWKPISEEDRMTRKERQEQKQEEEPLEIGEVVQLKSFTGPELTVIEIHDDVLKTVTVAWFNEEDEYRITRLSQKALERKNDI